MNPSLDVPSPTGSALPVPSSIPAHNPEKFRRCAPPARTPLVSNSAACPALTTQHRARLGSARPGRGPDPAPPPRGNPRAWHRPLRHAPPLLDQSASRSSAVCRQRGKCSGSIRANQRCVLPPPRVLLARAEAGPAALPARVCRGVGDLGRGGAPGGSAGVTALSSPRGSGDVIPPPSPWRPRPAWRGGLSPNSGVFPAPRDPGVPLASPVIRRTGEPLPGRAAARGRVSRRAGVPGHGMGWQHRRGASAVGSRVRPIPPELGRGPGAPCCSGGRKLPGGRSGVGRRGAKFSLCFKSE